MTTTFVRTALAAGAAAWAGAALAQSTLPQVTITGNPLGSSDLVAPAGQLSGADLATRSHSSLGETLNQLPGVSSTYFGPTASRPAIRGLDGDRIRILSNGGAALDVSNLSYDHAVAADPLTMERIEVLRGPAALLYGGNAIGGVVNVIDNRIPREAAEGVLGKVDVGYATGSREKSGAAMLETGSSRLGLHVDAFRRSQGEVRAPVALACGVGLASTHRRICNSASDADGGALGGSLLFDRGFLGASASTYRSSYGSVAEDDVTIGMRSNRYALEGEVRPRGWLQSVRLRLGHGEYQHTEYDAGEAGTVFRIRGNDLRLEARHERIGPLEGVVGVQAESIRFSADGAEAFAPASHTRQHALFIHEELPTSWGKLTGGARLEHVQVDAGGNPEVPRLAVASRSFAPASGSLGALWNVAPGWQVTASLAHSQRAPKDYELYADGPHVATGAYEVGDPSLSSERSSHLEAGVQWKNGAHSWRLNAFASRFASYIALLSTGRLRDADGNHATAAVGDCGDATSVQSGCTMETLPELAYRGVRARFRGLEASGTTRLVERAGHAFDLEARADLVRAQDRTNGQPLPRIAPARVGLTGVWTRGAWSARAGFDHHAAQRRMPAGDAATAAYTLWHAGASYRSQWKAAGLLWYARLDNAGDRLAYSATSILTQTAPGRVPLPGRSLKLGVRADF